MSVSSQTEEQSSTNSTQHKTLCRQTRKSFTRSPRYIFFLPFFFFFFATPVVLSGKIKRNVEISHIFLSGEGWHFCLVVCIGTSVFRVKKKRQKMDPFTVLLHGDKKQHLWCGPGETISFTLLSALVSLASKSAECVELEDLMSEQLSCCLNCVRVFHLTLSYSDADSLGLDEQDFALLRDYLEGLALNRVSKTLASGLGSDKRWTPALSNAFLEVLNYTSLLRNSSLFGVVEDFVVSLLDANVSIPKKSKCAGVFVLCASSVDRVHRWAEQYVGNCEAQGTIVSVDEVEDVLDRALDVLLDAAQGQRVIEGQNSVLGSSQGGLVVFEGERFYSSLWFLLERVTSDMKKHYFNNWTVRFSLLLRTVFTRVDAKLVGGDQPVRVLCSLIKACAMTGAAGEVSTSPEVLWGDPEVLSFADSLDMLMERGKSDTSFLLFFFFFD